MILNREVNEPLDALGEQERHNVHEVRLDIFRQPEEIEQVDAGHGLLMGFWDQLEHLVGEALGKPAANNKPEEVDDAVLDLELAVLQERDQTYTELFVFVARDDVLKFEPSKTLYQRCRNVLRDFKWQIFQIDELDVLAVVRMLHTLQLLMLQLGVLSQQTDLKLYEVQLSFVAR